MAKNRVSNGVDRRGFLKGAGAVAAGMVAVGLAGCSSNTSSSESTTTSDSESAGVEGYICGEDWLGSAPEIADSQISKTIDVDVVICGGGHAGCQAALAAAQEGASVAVIEMQSETSYAFFGDDICTYNSAFLTNRGFGGYDTGQIVDEFVRRSGGRVSTELIRKFVENSGEMLDNMMTYVPSTSDMFDFDNAQCQVQIAYGMPNSSYYPIEHSGFKAWATTIQTIGTISPTDVDGRSGVSRLTEFELYCMDAATNKGATWYFEHTAEVLVQNTEGDVTGAIATDADGNYVKFNANKGVILACGDFSGNADMVYNLLDDVNEVATRAGADRSEMTGMGRSGMGQKLGCWAGGYLESHPRPSMNTNGGNPGPWGTAPFLWINAHGKRFMNEALASYINPTVLKQPVGVVAAVCDANYMGTVRLAGLDHGAPNWGAAGVDALGRMDQLQEQMSTALGAGASGVDVAGVGIINVSMAMSSKVYAANTLEELLGYLGYSGDALKTALATIKEYNALCQAGKDTQYGKDAELLLPIETAPFYGSCTTNEGKAAAGLVTLAGLITDDDFNVLQEDRTTPIKGLYAAGNCLGQRFGIAYSTPSAGASMGMAMTHGRLAGKAVGAL